MRCRFALLALAALCPSARLARAADFYPTTQDLSLTQVNLALTTSANGGLVFDTTISALNNSAVTLSNVYLFTQDVTENGNELTLTAPGTYTDVAGDYADATNAAVFITQSQTDANLDAASAGSATTAEIPGFLIASTLLPGQQVNFDVDLSVPFTAGALGFNASSTANPAVTPEPASFLLLGTGLLGIVGTLRKRLA